MSDNNDDADALNAMLEAGNAVGHVVQADDGPTTKLFAELAPTPPDWSPSDDQEAARSGILSWWDNPTDPYITLGGYAGTGKTTLCGCLSYDLLNKGVNIAFAAPTGKAAQVLEKSLRGFGVTGAPVSTIHSLIYAPQVDEKTGRVLGWKRRREIERDLIILDEASMVTQQMMDDLTSYGVPIIAIGDHGQLPPVGEKASLMSDPTFRLDRIHRQARGNPIIRMATMIRNGAPNDALKAFIRDQKDPRIVLGTKEEALLHGAPPGMLISYTNRIRTSLNHQIRFDRFGYEDDVDPQPGEIVICLKNHRMEGNGGNNMIANGMRGTVQRCESATQNQYEMDIVFDDPVGLVQGLRVNKHQFGRENTFKGFDEVPGNHMSWWSVGALFDFGYALTCHKSQGSQAEKVAVFVEWALSRMDEDDRRRWMYTAVTRCSESLMMVF